MKKIRKFLSLFLCAVTVFIYAPTVYSAQPHFNLVLKDKGNSLVEGNLYLTDCTGLESFNFIMEFPDGLLKSCRAKPGKDVVSVLLNESSNTTDTVFNTGKPEKIMAGLYFYYSLWEQSLWDKEKTEVNAGNFNAFTFTFKLKEGKTAADMAKLIKTTVKACYIDKVKVPVICKTEVSIPEFYYEVVPSASGAVINLYLKKSEGLNCADINISFSPGVISSVKADYGEDSGKIREYAINPFVFEYHTSADCVNSAFFFKDKLWSSKEWKENGFDIDSEYFRALTFNCKLKEGKSAGDIKFEAKARTCKAYGVSTECISRYSFICTEHIPGKPSQEDRKEPTCTEPGYYRLVTRCSICGKILSSETREIPALPHKKAPAVTENIKAPACTEPGSSYKVIYCAVCGKELSREKISLPALNHSWDRGEITKAPGYNEPGIITFRCMNKGCTAIKTELIPKLEYLPGDADTDGRRTAADARIILRTSVGLHTLTPEIIIIADVDKDSRITSADARTVLRISVGLK